ncbi:MAG: Farnesyl diphosphate synthase [Candidatus Anoxychlamydiales bacterium]|nr:Farnesyl diphosphate synthase [Candidatus Anoxychlamydiales bacterium]NGX40699.1 Farnesyl diphosphate synthase [Candidatus Anoxychlamydiales bacterium]HEU64341.1 polyprenyl synthetase family protein [Chlamydiota bacterium]
MKEKIVLIENRLKELIPKNSSYQKVLFEAASYSLLSSGKRLRPLLVLATVEAFNKNIDLALDPAISLELIHTYSLIHDDLPCMDDDDFRRGKPSLHKAYPEWLAVLTGDYLLTYAFEIITNAKNLADTKKVKLIRALTKYSGGDGLIAGQVIDLSYEGKEIDFEKLKFMHLNKTAKLFLAAIEFGCIISDATNDTTNKFVEFAKNMGLAFQFFDDISDYDDKKSSDITKNKATAPAILGIEKAKAFALDLQKRALDILKSLSYNTSFLEEITSKMT